MSGDRNPSLTESSLSKNETKQAINALPGPPRTLFFGNTLQMDKHHLPAWIHNQAKTYDEGLMRVSFLSTHSIMLNTWEAENEAYVTRGSDCMGVPFNPRAKIMGGTDISLSSVAEPHYAALRQCLATAISTTFKLDSMQKIQRQIIVQFGQTWADQRAVNLKESLIEYVENVTASLTFGEKYDRDSEQVQAIHLNNRVFCELFLEDRSVAILDMMPSLWKYPCFKSGAHEKVKNDRAMLTEIAKNQIVLARAKYKKTRKITSVIEHLLHRQEQGKQGDSIDKVTDDAIQGCIFNLALGSVETLGRTLLSFFAPLLVDEKLQKKLQKYIDDRFEQDYVISMQDREDLPLISSYVLECVRFYCIIPLQVPHATVRDTTVAGYQIPAGTGMMCNIMSIMRDPKIYAEPDKFKPERFLDREGLMLPQDHPSVERIRPHGIGMRKCPATSFSAQYRADILIHMLQHYTLKPYAPLSYENIDTYNQKCQFAFINQSYPTDVTVTERRHGSF